MKSDVEDSNDPTGFPTSFLEWCEVWWLSLHCCWAHFWLHEVLPSWSQHLLLDLKIWAKKISWWNPAEATFFWKWNWTVALVADITKDGQSHVMMCWGRGHLEAEIGLRWRSNIHSSVYLVGIELANCRPVHAIDWRHLSNSICSRSIQCALCSPPHN